MRAAAAALAICVAGCAHGPPAKTAATVWYPGAERQLSERDEDLFGSEIHLRWAGDTWRGDAYGQLVELTEKDGHVSGTFGGTPVDLTVEIAGDVTHVRGLFRTELGDLRIGPSAIEGKMGRCSYDLKSSDGSSYTGYRQCRAPTEPTRVTLSSFLPHPIGAGRAGPLLILISQ
ncbi:MAG: hypothetical protein ACJ790_20015 [Myxococcaceae bacterium]